MTTHNKSIHLQVTNPVFQECSNVPVTRGDDVPDVPVNKDLPWVGKVDATEVKIRMLQGEDTREGFYDVVKVDGTWRWTLTTRSLSAFEAGNCPP